MNISDGDGPLSTDIGDEKYHELHDGLSQFTLKNVFDGKIHLEFFNFLYYPNDITSLKIR